ncbi:MAG: inorganic phosphate transporter [Acidimicrobiales bacterium]
MQRAGRAGEEVSAAGEVGTVVELPAVRGAAPVALGIMAVAFAYSMGAHYTGACMGMPHALGAVSARRALWLMAPLALLGAAFASHAVEHTVGFTLTMLPLGAGAEIVVLAVAFGLTIAFTQLRVPTSTIQILVLSLAGVALGTGDGVRWARIGLLAIVWVAAPVTAAALGFVLTRALGALAPARRGETGRERGTEVGAQGGIFLAVGLVAVGMAASFTMGANDVANATGSLVGTGTLNALAAGTLGGAGLAVGALTWGRPLLQQVAFEIVELDRAMATAAQLVQAAVVAVAVGFGLFTSLNQALVGAMAGAGAARGRHTVRVETLKGIVRGWVIGPGAGIALGYVIARVVTAISAHALTG